MMNGNRAGSHGALSDEAERTTRISRPRSSKVSSTVPIFSWVFGDTDVLGFGANGTSAEPLSYISETARPVPSAFQLSFQAYP